MKKLMTMAAVALCGAVGFGDGVTSANVVGYAGHNVKRGIYYTVPMFQGMNTADGGVTLGTLIPGGNFDFGFDMLTLKNNGNKFIVKKDGVPTGLSSVFQYFSQDYFDGMVAGIEEIIADPWGVAEIDPDDTETLAALEEEKQMYLGLTPGWYLIDDTDPDVSLPAYSLGNFNDYPLDLGMGFFMTTAGGATLQSSGEVANEDLYLTVKQGIYYTGNCTPVDRTLGELIPGGNFDFGFDMLTMKNNGNKFIVKDQNQQSTGFQSVFQYFNQEFFDGMVAGIEEIIADPWGMAEIDPGDTETLAALEEEKQMYLGLTPGWYLIDDTDPDVSLPAYSIGDFNWYPVPAGYAFFMTTAGGATLKCPKAL